MHGDVFDDDLFAFEYLYEFALDVQHVEMDNFDIVIF